MADKKRRDKGDGCISQRADGTWTARIRVGLTPEGKPKIKAFYGKSEREVKKKLKEFEKELHKNDMSVVQKGTVESYMLNWLRSVKSNELKPKSYDEQKSCKVYHPVLRLHERIYWTGNHAMADNCVAVRSFNVPHDAWNGFAL